MTDRLKQIWSGFEGVTTRRLVSGGVENIDVPNRHEFSNDEQPTLPPEFHAPSAAALDALKTRLLAAEKAAKAPRRTKGKKRPLHDGASFSASDHQHGGAMSFEGAPPETKAMLRGLKSTQDRTERPHMLYSADMAKRASAELDSLKKRKKFLGIF